MGPARTTGAGCRSDAPPQRRGALCAHSERGVPRLCACSEAGNVRGVAAVAMDGVGAAFAVAGGAVADDVAAATAGNDDGPADTAVAAMLRRRTTLIRDAW